MIALGSSAEDRRAALIDATVAEVFDRMLHQTCAPATQASTAGPIISARIVFSGMHYGHCVVETSPDTALRIADVLLGAEGVWDDEIVDDTVGELCNMIAGGWKGRLESVDSTCSISVPVISRRPASVRSLESPTQMRRFYTFHGAALEVRIALQESPRTP